MNSNQLIGIGARPLHYNEIITKQPSIGWLEIHSENYFSQGGKSLAVLWALIRSYPISLHGVGLSLGSAEGVSIKHLERLSNLINRIDPKLVSEHLSWGYVDGLYIPDLLPIPYTEESFNIFKHNILITQDFLKHKILIENPSSYIEYKSSNQDESKFLVDLCRATGAEILLDVNNIFVSCWNHGWNAKKYIDSIPVDLVKEIHIAGHSIKELPDNQTLRVDTHNNYVCNEVWDLYGYAIARFGPTPTLLEWDSDIPTLDVLIEEASKCEPYLFP